MARIRGYIATSLDGYIATADGGVEWLSEFQQHDFGYDRFFAEIGTVVVGRTTFDQVMRDFGWPYRKTRGIVLTHRPVEDLPPGCESWGGEVADLAPRLRGLSDGDTWVIGGAAVQQQFLDAGALDRIEVFVVPVLLGRGVPLWPPSPHRHRLTLRAAEALPGGLARLDYDIGSPG